MLDKTINLMRDVGRDIRNWANIDGKEGFWEGHQFHAKADILAHNKIYEGLQAICSDIPILSEEGEFDPSVSMDKYWLIDPIDGTASYAQGFPGYVTQVALMNDGKPELAVVYAPHFDEVFYAEIGKGAFKNGKRIFCRNKDDNLTLVDNYPEPRGIANIVFDKLKFKHYLESGSIGLKICRVAEGVADLFLKDVVVMDWDLAAPHLIISEAQGTLKNYLGGDIIYSGNSCHKGLIACGNLSIIKKVLDITDMHSE